MLNYFTNTTADKTLRTLQLIELECVKELDRICRKYKIEYALGGGTCLGQCRHNGFIPWDDDIDIDMDVENYDRFMAVAPDEIDKTRFKLVCKATTAGYYRTMSRIEAVGTCLNLPRWDNYENSVGVYIDICRIVYLPEEKELREKISKKLFFLRATENFVMTDSLHKRLSLAERIEARLCKNLGMIDSVMKKEETVIGKYCRKPTTWMFADNLMDNNHNGYHVPNNGQYKDVEFEGITLRDRKNQEEFLRALYGDSFMEWLSPTKRISHHKWTDVDFGEYRNRFNLPDNYADYITSRYYSEKLKQMQRVSGDMLAFVDRICREHSFKYYVAGYDALLEASGKTNIAKYWREPASVVMPRTGYNEFVKLLAENTPQEYYLQVDSKDDNYRYHYARLCLNYTELRESELPFDVREKIHSGFHIRIIPMDEAAKNQEKLNTTINRKSELAYLKWTKKRYDNFKRLRKKKKLMLLANSFKTSRKLAEEIDSLMKKGNTANAEAYRVSVNNDKCSYTVGKDIFGKGEEREYNGYRLFFPENSAVYLKSDIARHTTGYPEIMANDFDEEEYLRMLVAYAGRKYPRCSLTYYDAADYQLSVLSYDEKNDRKLTLKEIIEEKK